MSTDELVLGSGLSLVSALVELATRDRAVVRTLCSYGNSKCGRGGVAELSRWSLHDATEARLAALRELLADDGSHDDVIELEWSLGGVAEWRDGELDV